MARVSTNSGPVLTHLWTKVRGILGKVGDPSYFSTPLPDCLYHVSFGRYSPLGLSLEVVEKPNKCKSFWPQFFPEGRAQVFYSRLLARFTVHRMAQFG